MARGWFLGLARQGSLRKLRWVAIFAPAGALVLWELVSHFYIHSLIASERVLFLLTVLVIALGASAFTQAFFRLLEQLQKELFQQNRELASRTTALEALYEIGTSLSALLDLDTISKTAVRRARQLLESDAAGLALLHESTGEVRWELLTGAGGEFKNLKVPLGQCLGGQAIQSGEPVIVEDVGLGNDLPAMYGVLAAENLRAALVTPIRVAGKPVGALMVGHRAPYSFHLNHLKLLVSLGNQVAVAINNATLLGRLRALSVVEERERLAREMHDSLAQLLGHVTARAAAAGELLAQGRAEEAHEHLRRLRDVSQEAYLEVRQSILGLRSRPFAKGSFLEAIAEYVRRITEDEGIPVRLVTGQDGPPPELTPAVEVQAIRIIQEALSNVRKHSRAQEAWVRVEWEGAWITITIQDNGRGFDPSRADGRGGHFGLHTMRERAESVGGRLVVESAPGKGTSVIVRLPTVEED